MARSHSQESGNRRESGGKSGPHAVKRSELWKVAGPLLRLGFTELKSSCYTFCPSPDLRSPLWAQATGEQSLGNPWPRRPLLRAERGSDRARWPGRRGVEVLRGPSAGTWAVWLLSAGAVCQFHPRQQLYIVWGPRDVQLERYDLGCIRRNFFSFCVFNCLKCLSVFFFATRRHNQIGAVCSFMHLFKLKSH